MPNVRLSWPEIARRAAAGEDLEALIDQNDLIDRAQFMAWIREDSGYAAAEKYLATMHDIDTGVHGARRTWHSISNTQRRVLITVAKTRSGKVVRRFIKPSFYVLNGGVDLLCRVATLRNLCARDLMAWDGGAFEPELAAVITERGQFVIRHGMPQ